MDVPSSNPNNITKHFTATKTFCFVSSFPKKNSITTDIKNVPSLQVIMSMSVVQKYLDPKEKNRK